LETQYTMKVRDGRLVAEQVRYGEFSLTPTAKDQFRSNAWFMPEVRFVHDGSDRITAVVLGGRTGDGDPV
jgi:hypothetical protein